MSVPSTWPAYLAMLGLTAMLWLLFRGIFSLRNDPAYRPGAVYIGQRTLAKSVTLLFMAAASFVIVAGFVNYSSESYKWIWCLVLGPPFAIFAGYVGNTHLWLDTTGMHFRSGLGKAKSLPWERLDHYEVRVVNNNDSTDYYYDFRTYDGATISLPSGSYDMRQLLLKIRAYADIHQQPYRY